MRRRCDSLPYLSFKIHVWSTVPCLPAHLLICRMSYSFNLHRAVHLSSKCPVHFSIFLDKSFPDWIINYMITLFIHDVLNRLEDKQNQSQESICQFTQIPQMWNQPISQRRIRYKSCTSTLLSEQKT